MLLSDRKQDEGATADPFASTCRMLTPVNGCRGLFNGIGDPEWGAGAYHDQATAVARPAA
jgi:hypothetical protein